MKISPFQAVLFAVFGLFALVGIFVFANYTSTNGGKDDVVGTVVVWGTLPAKDMKVALDAIKQADQTLKSVSYVQKSEVTLSSELAAAIATGAGPDLLLASHEILASLAPFVTPIPAETLPAATFTSSFTEGSQVFALPDGRGYYGIPLLVDPVALFSNNAILASSGVPKPPETWEALTGLVPKVAIFTPSRQITRGLIGFGTYDNVHSAKGLLSSLFFQADVPIVSYRDGAPDVNLRGSSVGGQRAGDAVLTFYTQFADPAKVSYTWNASLEDSQKAFYTGQLALYPGFISEARFIRAANPNISVIVSPLPVPEQKLAAGLRTVYGRHYALMIPRGSANASGAFNVAALLLSDDAQASLASATGLAPASLTALAVAPADPDAVVAYAEALYARGWLSPAPGTVDTAFSGMINNVISGRTTIGSALSLGEGTLREAL